MFVIDRATKLIFRQAVRCWVSIWQCGKILNRFAKGIPRYITMWKNIEPICERNSEIYYLRVISSISVGVILRKGSVEFHTLACHCKHVHIVRSSIQAFGIFLARIPSSFVMYRYIFVLLRSSPWKLLWSHVCERCFDNHSSFHSSHIRNAMSKVAPEPFGFQKM